MDYRLLIVVIAIWASGTCSSHPGPQTDTQTSVLPVAQPLRTEFECKVNTDCPDNHFCEEQRSQKKRCKECVDCKLFERKPKKSYDGETCAAHQTQCGECNDGFEELGGVCLPIRKTSWISNDAITTVAEKEDVTQNENDHKKEESVEAGTAYWVVALFIGVIFITFILAVTTKFYHRKSYPTHIEEEAGLTSCPSSGINGPYEQSPSAPPLEYHTQPAHYSHEQSYVKPSYNRLKEPEIYVNALPFQNGFGATDGNDYVGMGDDGPPVNLPDSVDGAAASTPAASTSADAGIPTQNANAVQNHAAGIGRATGTSTRHFGAGGTPNLSLLPRSNQHSPSFGPVQPEANTQDPVYVSILASLNVMMRYPSATTASNEASHPSPIRSIASAPTSPFPRQMDDTHAVDLPRLQGSFLRSNVSMDSGTGSGSEHDRSVPSRSVSGGFSELDESYMYDDSDSSPSTFARHQAARVPQQGDEYLQEEEPMEF